MKGGIELKGSQAPCSSQGQRNHKRNAQTQQDCSYGKRTRKSGAEKAGGALSETGLRVTERRHLGLRQQTRGLLWLCNSWGGWVELRPPHTALSFWPPGS